MLTVAYEGGILILFDLLLQSVKQLRAKESIDRNAKPVAKLLNCRYRGTVVPAADNIVYGRLGNAADTAQLII